MDSVYRTVDSTQTRSDTLSALRCTLIPPAADKTNAPWLRLGASLPDDGANTDGKQDVALLAGSPIVALCEIYTMHEGLSPDLPLGTHFFNDLVEKDMLLRK